MPSLTGWLPLLLIAAPLGAQPASRAFDVRTFGATGDGHTIDSDAINRAIDAAAAAGGGTVYLGAGTYASYSVRLKSHVALYLDRGATLLAADTANGRGFDAAEPGPGNEYQDYGHSHWHNSLIWGEDVEDVSIVGPGRIDGKSLNRGISRDTPHVGNKAIALLRAKNVLLRDLTIYRGGHFGVLATGVDNLTIDNLTIDTNRDGIDVDACRNVRISNTSVNSPNDDAIVLKASYALGATRGTENVTLTNSVVTGFAVGSVLDATYRPFTDGAANRDGPTGRVKLGTESNGPFRNITISNIVFDNSRGLALESVDGSIIEDVTVTNLTMRHVFTSPIFLRLGSRMRGPKELPVGTLKRVTISNVVASDVDPRYASTITGLPGHAVEDVTLRDVRIVYRGGLSLETAAKQPSDMVRSGERGGGGPRSDPYAVAEQEKVYPEPSMFGIVPASAFYVRHVTGLTMDGIDVSFEQPDTRPAFVLDDVHDAEFRGVHAPKIAGTPTFVLRGVSDFRTLFSRPVADTYVKQTTSKSF
ncbi:glycoside hydrolase family protein (plasmid) [Gemmatirosa kalamazoonensis]|uniref:Glycoside hydrolase family protein n=1 Tax=Gemmatirosa kalamazoonensis TaxID=861299 RepID=W0RU91_9BACT|nr:glycosyl hydrolase family 28-related protein [Gemmatirosa kalamazoonensis]AHG93153.1 glycoside hydrolase family protein [Gemmatirosa kalamazoonensis]